jgi:beta-glucanase (GH16 family)
VVWGIDVSQWHVYAINWDSSSITWFVDGRQFHQVSIRNGVNSTQEFHAPHYILLNLPIGGTWPEPPDASTPLPATMFVDYVRVYGIGATAVSPVVASPVRQMRSAFCRTLEASGLLLDAPQGQFDMRGRRASPLPAHR